MSCAINEAEQKKRLKPMIYKGKSMLCRVLAVVACVILPIMTAAKTPKVVIPAGALPITSDYRSMKGVNGLRRSARHQGIDIPGPYRQSIIAVAPGKVLDVEVGKCWGPTLTVDHGTDTDGKQLIVLYGHLGDVSVKKGQSVKRGQLVGRLGNNHKTFKCIAGVRHLHLQIGRKARVSNRGNSWGHVRFLKDGKKGVNPHLYWADGPGKVTCFRKGVKFAKGTLTYPLPCK